MKIGKGIEIDRHVVGYWHIADNAEVLVDGVTVLRLSYGDSTDLFRLNLGWANQTGSQPLGFSLDLERGYWARNQADEDDQDDAASYRCKNNSSGCSTAVIRPDLMAPKRWYRIMTDQRTCEVRTSLAFVPDR
jgi:hypothetical protein